VRKIRRKRLTIEAPVRALHQIVGGLAAGNGVIEHIYDY
jgi:hypothetical protein